MSNARHVTAKTPAQAKADLDRRGIPIAAFARKHGLHYGTVCQVLTGAKKGRRGEAHRAAVLLGIKRGVAGSVVDIAIEDPL
jgi:gp16 family phage-associated protein